MASRSHTVFPNLAVREPSVGLEYRQELPTHSSHRDVVWFRKLVGYGLRFPRLGVPGWLWSAGAPHPKWAVVKSANLGETFLLVTLIAIRLVRIVSRRFLVLGPYLEKPLTVFLLIVFL